jgi:hypothetical protein
MAAAVSVFGSVSWRRRPRLTSGPGLSAGQRGAGHTASASGEVGWAGYSTWAKFGAPALFSFLYSFSISFSIFLICLISFA